jgi:ParB/RepB/Spo0J family partition protein
MTPPSVPAFSAADPAVTPPGIEKAPKAERADLPAPVSDPARTMPPVPTGRERDLIDGTAVYKMVHLDDITEDPDNPRKIYRNIDELAESLKKNGLLEPISCRIDQDGKLWLMYGHRRLRAAKRANWKTIPTIIRYGVKDASILARQLVENSQRSGLDPMEEAVAIRRYMREQKMGTYAECAASLGHSLGWVTTRVALLDLDEDDQNKISSGELTLMEGAKIARRNTGNTRVSRKMREEGGMTDANNATGKTASMPTAWTPSYATKNPPHFSDEHFLAGRARSRCSAAAKAGDVHKPMIGGVACGSCWEVVIRLDARRNGDVLAGTRKEE